MIEVAKTILVCLGENAMPRIPVVLYRGAAGSMLIAGGTSECRFLSGRLFGQEPVTSEIVARAAAWRLPSVLASWRTRADIVCAAVDQLSARCFPRDSYLCVPTWIRMMAPVPTVYAEHASANARRYKTLVRKQRLTWCLSRKYSDLDTFIARDYRPYVCARYGPDAHVRSIAWFRRAFRKGGLIWVYRDSEPVAGVVYDCHSSSLRYLAVACTNGDARLLRTGAISATYLACFELAREMGMKLVDFRNCRPSLCDGVLQAKRSWGGYVVQPDDVFREYLVGWHAVTPAVTRFCSDGQLIVRDAGGFSALSGPGTGPDRVPPGISRLLMPVPDGEFGDMMTRQLVR